VKLSSTLVEPPIPLLDLGSLHASLADELKGDFERVLGSGQFILGKEHDLFEQELARACGATHAVGLSSGTAAITIALQAMGVAHGDEVIVPAFTYFATASAVAQLGARPVFVDVEPVRFGADPDAVARALGPRTRAVVPVHLYGLACDLDPIVDAAREGGVEVLEDAAQAIGATDGGRPVGTTTAGATLSFFPTKNLGALGDAGAFITERGELAAQVRLLRAQGDAGDYRHTALGTNARLDALQAAFLRTKMRHLNDWIEQRRASAALYRDALVGSPAATPAEPEGARHTYHQFTILAPERDRLQRHLAERGIASRVYYPVPLHLQPCFSELGYGPGDFPVAERLAGGVLSLPIFPGITPEQIRRVAGAIRSFYSGPRGS